MPTDLKTFRLARAAKLATTKATGAIKGRYWR